VRPWQMPLPQVSWLTAAEDHDLTAAQGWNN